MQEILFRVFQYRYMYEYASNVTISTPASTCVCSTLVHLYALYGFFSVKITCTAVHYGLYSTCTARRAWSVAALVAAGDGLYGRCSPECLMCFPSKTLWHLCTCELQDRHRRCDLGH